VIDVDWICGTQNKVQRQDVVNVAINNRDPLSDVTILSSSVPISLWNTRECSTEFVDSTIGTVRCVTKVLATPLPVFTGQFIFPFMNGFCHRSQKQGNGLLDTKWFSTAECVQKRIHFGIHLQNVVITKMMLYEMGRDDHAE
jgi:hypothetical protein